MKVKTISIESSMLRERIILRGNDSHKHQYGHALIIAGCRTMPGAAIMATGAALKSGCGLVTLHSTASAISAAVIRYPSAMLSLDDEDCFSRAPESLEKYSSIGIGPGLGKAPATKGALRQTLQKASGSGIPMVIDADAINLLAGNDSLCSLIPEGSVLTPHEGEARRLFGAGTREQMEASALEFCAKFRVFLVLKGFRTRVISPEGSIYENTTGNPGMAKGGSGDVLTGLLTGLIARGYSPLDAALLAVWIHGYAGDCLSRDLTQEAWAAQELIDYLPEGFRQLFLEQR